MNHTKRLSVLAIAAFMSLGITTQSMAQMPSGQYSGFISNNPFNEWCRMNRADMEFTKNTDGSVDVYWVESGFAQYPGTGFCENRWDVKLTPTNTAGVWDARFLFDWDLNWGRATLKGNLLTIEGTYTGTNTGRQRMITQFELNSDASALDYSRRIDRWGGSSMWANGTLYAE